MVEVPLGGRPTPVHLVQAGPTGGPRLLMLHGWGASLRHMQPLMDVLSTRFRMAAIDFPGHGQSPPPASGYGMDGHLEVIEGILRHLGWTSYGIVGHSNGGRAALTWTATRGGDTVSCLTLIAPSGIRRKRSAAWYVKTWTARILKAPFSLFPRPVKDAGLDWLRHSLVWRLLGSSDYRALEGVMRETFVRTVNHYVEDLLPSVNVPVLVIRGSTDDAITHDQVQRLVDGLPDAGLFTIDGAGHYAQLDRTDVVAAAIAELAAR